jgi:serine/threonine protein kinase
LSHGSFESQRAETGMVLRGHDGPGRTIAVKVPRYGALAEEREAIVENGLLREAEVLAALRAESLPALIARDTAGRFLCRSFVPGRSLEEIALTSATPRRRRLALAAALIVSAADLFSRFHQRPTGGYVIRDFKPRNLVVRHGDGAIVLIDVGSVRSERKMLSNRRRMHRIGSGAWRFWPPEQLLEDGGLLDRRVDYFALGGTLHTILLGAPAYRNLAPAEALNEAYRAEHGGLVEGLQRAAWVPDALREYMSCCLSPLPNDRPQSVPAPRELGLEL